MPPFIQNILALPAKTKAILGVSAFAILAIAFLMLKIATAPAYSTIASGLDPAQTGKITAALDEQGYVRMPNVDTVTEMVDLIDAQRAYEANVTAMSASKQMFAKTLEILR